MVNAVDLDYHIEEYCTPPIPAEKSNRSAASKTEVKNIFYQPDFLMRKSKID